MIVLGFEVDKSSKIFTKTWNSTKYIELDNQNIETLRTNDPIIEYV